MISATVSWLSLKMKLCPRCRKYLRDGHRVVLARNVLNAMTGNTSVQLLIYCFGEKRRGLF